MMTTALLYGGRLFRIHALVEDGHVLYEEFVMNELTATERRAIDALVHYVAEYGTPHNQERYKDLRGGVAELKKGRVRVYCFFDGPGRLVVANGSVEHSSKRQTRDIDRAITLRNAYFQDKGRKRGG